MRRTAITILGFCLLVLLMPARAGTLGDYANDARSYVVAPLHWDRTDWAMAAAATAATFATYTQDERVRTHFGGREAQVTGDPHSLRDAAPMALLVAGTWALGELQDDSGLKGTAADMTEAVLLSSASGFVLKQAWGRARPDKTTDRDTWFGSGVSFPSGHTAAMFAAAQVLVDRHPGEWGWGAAAYGLGALTAYARLSGNMHWASDTVAGAVLGMATGRFVSNRRALRNASPERLGFSVEPLPGGAMLSIVARPFGP